MLIFFGFGIREVLTAFAVHEGKNTGNSRDKSGSQCSYLEELEPKRNELEGLPTW